MESKILKLVESTLPKGAYIEVRKRKNFFGGYYIMIMFASSDHEINRVSGQYTDVVSLSLDLDNMELEGQCFGGNGGLSLYFTPDPNHPKEKYLALASQKIPFRKPKKEEKFVLNAIEKFCKNWIKIIQDNQHRLHYKNYVDYSYILNHKI